jgi:kynurenine formamidase
MYCYFLASITKEVFAVRRIIDLSFTIREHWRWLPKLYAISTFKDYHFLTQRLDSNLHGFTHVDSTLHFMPNGPSMEKMPLEKYMGEAAVVNLSHLDENDGVTAEDLERRGQHIKTDDIVLLRTDWPRKCDYMTRDFWGQAPYTTREACEWLIGRKVKAVGYDYPPDYVLRKRLFDSQYKDKPEENTTHYVLLKEGVVAIEYLCNLHLITRNRVQFMALPLRIEGAEGSPVRAIAIEE